MTTKPEIDKGIIVIIVALGIVGIMTSILIILDYYKGDAEHILTLFPIVIGSIFSLVGLAFGINAQNELIKTRNQIEAERASDKIK